MAHGVGVCAAGLGSISGCLTFRVLIPLEVVHAHIGAFNETWVRSMGCTHVCICVCGGGVIVSRVYSQKRRKKEQ